MESDNSIFFQLNICFTSDETKNQSSFIRCKPKQTIGDAILHEMSDQNVTISKVYTVSPPSKTRSETPTSTPVEILAGFGARIVFVDVRSIDEERQPPTKCAKLATSTASNAFAILMNVQKKYDVLPKQRNEVHAKDRLFNHLLLKLKDRGVGFTPIQVDVIGRRIVKTLADSLWYIDPHHTKFENRAIILPEFFSKLKDYNDWRVQKKKEPMV